MRHGRAGRFPPPDGPCGCPGLADNHVHFLPPSVVAKVWPYFDAAEDRYGWAWPVQYRTSEEGRQATLRRLGARPIPSLT